MTALTACPKPPASKWHWSDATVVQVHDGDTIRVSCPTHVDPATANGTAPLPFGAVLGYQTARHAVLTVTQPQDVRLWGGNAAELATDLGKRTQARVLELMPLGSLVGVTTYSLDKWGGRYDASITLPDGRDLATVLHDEGLFAWWDAQGQKPTPTGTPPATSKETA